MRIPAALLPAVVALAACASSGGSGADADRARAEEESAARLRARADALYAEEAWDDARAVYREIHEEYPGSPLAPEAQFLAAECAWLAGRAYAAGELFLKYAEDRPLSPRIPRVEARLYECGDRLITEGSRGLWGLGIFTTSEEGVNVLRRMATLLPTGPRADDALLRVGRWYAEQRDFAGAESTLEELLKGYPSSEWRLEARFLVAWTYREDNRGPAYDGEKLRRARAHFLAFVEQAESDADRATENADRIAAAKEAVAGIDADLARKALLRARFYRRTGKEKAALAVLAEAGRRWGDTEPGRECAAKAAELAAELGEPLPAGPAAPPADGDAP